MQPRPQIVGLMRLSPGVVYESLLTPWSPEAEFLRDFFQLPQDLYTLRVDECRQLDVPQVVTHRLARRGHTGELSVQPI